MPASSPVLAAGAVVVRDAALLLVKRATEPARGLWTIPGGRVEAGEYVRDAVKREVREETGLEVEVGEMLGMFEVIGDEHFVILDFIATSDGSSDPRAASDAAEARWVPLDEVPTMDCTPRLIEMLRGWGVLPGDQDPETR